MSALKSTLWRIFNSRFFLSVSGSFQSTVPKSFSIPATRSLMP